MVPGGSEKKVTYHDPCYLGKHNGVYKEPRKVPESVPGLELVEMERTKDFSLCCGGGGGRFWTGTKAEERSPNLRLEEALAPGAKEPVTACPFCVLNSEDGVNGTQEEENLSVKDAAELLLVSS